MVATVLRLIALPVLAFAFFIAYTHSLPIAQSLLPTASDVGVGPFIAAIGVLAAGLATLWAVIFALPFSWLYRRRSAPAALVCIAPILIVIWARSAGRPPTSLLSWLPAVFFFLTLMIIVPTVAHITYRVFHRDTGQSA
jgi:hypothetical protein